MSYRHSNDIVDSHIKTGDIIKPIIILMLGTLCLLGALTLVLNSTYPWDKVYPGITTLAQLEDQWGKPVQIINVDGGGKTYVYSHWRFTWRAKFKQIYVYVLDDSDVVQVVSLIPFYMSINQLHNKYGMSFNIGTDRAGTRYMLDHNRGVFAEYHGGRIDFLCIYNTDWVFKEGWNGSRYVSDPTTGVQE